MSFSSNVKQELCRQPLTRRAAAVAEFYGVLLFCNMMFTIVKQAG